MRFTLICRWSVQFIVVLAILCAVGCSDQRKAAGHLEKADAFFKAGDYESARLEYLNVLRLTPTDPEAIRRLGTIYYEEGALLSAAPFLIETAKLEPDNAAARTRLGKLYAAGGQLQKAREEAVAAVNADPGNEEAVLALVEMPGTEEDLARTRTLLNELRPRANKAAVYRLADAVLALREQHRDEAESDVREALKLDDQLASAYFLQANLFEMQSNVAEAERAFKRAAELSPVRSDRRVRYAEFKLRHGATEEAKALVAAQLKEAPDYLPALSVQARIAFAERKPDEALKLCNTLLDRYAFHLDANLLRARIRVIQNEPAKGLEELARVERAFGGLPQFRFQMAVLQGANQESNKAMATLQEIVRTTPNFADAVLLLARMNLERDRADQAVQGLSAYLKIQPDNRSARLLLANAHVAARQYDQALAIYRDFAKQYPTEARGPFLVGLVLRQQGKTDEARQEFERALVIEPKFLAAAVQLVELDLADQLLGAALKRAQAVVEQAPDAAEAYLLLARVQSAQTNRVAAQAALEKAIDVDPKVTAAYYLLARVYRDEHRLRPALAQIDQLLAQTTNDVRALMLKATIHSELNEPEQARDAYEALLAVDPEFGPALNNLAYIYVEKLPDLEKAWRYARRARELEPDSPETADTLGWVYFKRGDYGEALRLISEATEKLPAQPELQYHLGMAHYMMAQETPARAAFERALTMAKDFEDRAETKRRLELLVSDPRTGGPEARRRLEEQVKREPRDVLALVRLADAQIKADELSEAQSTLDTVLKVNRDLPQATLTLAELKAREGQHAEALRLVRRAREAAPGDGELAWRGGQVAMECHDGVLGLILLEEAARRTGDRPEVLSDLAEATYLAGRLDEASRLCRRVIQAKPATPILDEARQLDWLIQVYHQPASVGSEGESRITAILKQHPEDVAAQMAMAGVLGNAGKTDEARAIYDKVLAQVSGFPQAHRELALLYAGEGPLSDPAKAYDHAVKARQTLTNDALLAKTLGVLTYRRGDARYAEQLLREAAKAFPADTEIQALLKKIKGD